MSIVIIVNIIVSLGIMLGGFGMKQRSKSSEDYSIGFRTKRAMSSKDAWSFANQKCGVIWIVIGILAFILTISMVFIIQIEGIESVVQSVILISLIVATIISVIVIENQLKNKFDDNN